MIKLVIFDIDGVLTDGSIIVDSGGSEQKKLNIKDIDAIYELKRQGFLLAAITGEQTDIVTYFKGRFPWDCFCAGNKRKLEAVCALTEELGVTLEETAYVGDGKYDLEVLPQVGLSFCPADAIEEARRQADIILSRPGGSGCVWELLDILRIHNQPALPEHFFYERLAEHRRLFHSLASDQKLIRDVMAVGQALVERLSDGGKLLLCGNGGSAADAQHIAAEFIGRFYRERAPLDAEALTVNSSALTALGNDYGYERIFVRQLQAKARPGDVLIGISTSGVSKNVLEALRWGKGQGLLTVMLMGDYRPQELEGLCAFTLRAPSTVTPRIQEAHIFIGHLLAEFVEDRLFGSKSFP